ncbi:MAG: hypothetical protein JEZ06_12520 [Anaerolineaceae bacterium]|nr:hypothetical protein [Anaerolineaceae bacterium]
MFNFPFQYIYLSVIIVFLGMCIAYFFVNDSQFKSRVLRVIILGFFISWLLPALIALIRFQSGTTPLFPSWSFFSIIFIVLGIAFSFFPKLLYAIDQFIYKIIVWGLPISLILGLSVLLVFSMQTWMRDLLIFQIFLIGLFLLTTGFGFNGLKKRTTNLVRVIFYARSLDFEKIFNEYDRKLFACTDIPSVENLLTVEIPHALGFVKGEFYRPGQTRQEKFLGSSILEIRLSNRDRFFGDWRLFYLDPDEMKLMIEPVGRLANSAEEVLDKIILIDILGKELKKYRTDHHTHSRIQQSQLASREAERASLSRDLHDGPIQTLIGLNMRLGISLMAYDAISEEEKPGFKNDLIEMRAEIKALLKNLRQFCTNLRPPMLDILGLGAAVRSFASDWSRKSGIDVQFDLPETTMLEAIPEDVSVNLFRLVQEALANIQKHAQASNVTINLFWEGQALNLEIIDDGQGFQVPEVYKEQVLSGHFGLAGMQERVVLIGGNLSIESIPGKGTRVCVIWQSRN